MKLTSKVLTVFLAVVVLMTAVSAYLTIHSAYVDLERRQQDLAQRLADEMQEQLVAAWQTDGMRGIAKTLEARLRAADEPLALRWVWFDAKAPESELPRADVSSWATIRLGQILSVVKEETDGQRLLLTYLPIRTVGSDTGGLELAQPLAAIEQQTRQVVAGSLLVIITSALIGFAIAYGAGVLWVADPLKKLIAKTEKIGRGDFGDPLDLGTRDELNQLADALNAMAERLSAQQQTISAEMNERVKALQQLRHADRLGTLGRMAAGMAHELGTPLNVVAGRAALISSGRLSQDEILQSAKTIKSEADRITLIVQRLLDFARQRRPQRIRTDVWMLAQKTVELLQPIADKRGIVLQLGTPIGDCTANIDESQIQQVLTNLVVNAIHASPPQSGVLVDVEGRILDDARSQTNSDAMLKDGSRSAPGRVVVLQVSDSGPGVPPDLKERIFEPFFTTKDVGEGTGLGLSIVYGIVQEHGGTIEVQDRSPHGAVFCVTLPADGTDPMQP